MRNIVLIGMPGCGKTTVGHALAERLSLTFLCTDEHIEAATGMGIPAIFEKFGEPDFREYERAAVKELTACNSAVISTGGGAVLCPQNRRQLASGIVVWLRRDITRLAREGRPLSRGIDELRAMYDARKPIYEELADITVEVCGSVDSVVEEIVSKLPRHEES